jgi:hypothetical protein
MALESQLREEERGIFKLHGITGMLIATVLLLSILAGLTYMAIGIQQQNADKYYEIDQNINSIKFIDDKNAQYWKNK